MNMDDKKMEIIINDIFDKFGADLGLEIISALLLNLRKQDIIDAREYYAARQYELERFCVLP